MTSKFSILAIDLAKGSFQVCAVGPDGMVVFGRAMSRTRLATLLPEHPACIVAMEACATSHHWGRFAQSHGQEVRLAPAAYVKPFLKRRSEAKTKTICGIAFRPNDRPNPRPRARQAGRKFRPQDIAMTQGDSRTVEMTEALGDVSDIHCAAPGDPKQVVDARATYMERPGAKVWPEDQTIRALTRPAIRHLRVGPGCCGPRPA